MAEVLADRRDNKEVRRRSARTVFLTGAALALSGCTVGGANVAPTVTITQVSGVPSPDGKLTSSATPKVVPKIVRPTSPSTVAPADCWKQGENIECQAKRDGAFALIRHGRILDTKAATTGNVFELTRGQSITMECGTSSVSYAATPKLLSSPEAILVKTFSDCSG